MACIFRGIILDFERYKDQICQIIREAHREHFDSDIHLSHYEEIIIEEGINPVVKYLFDAKNIKILYLRTENLISLSYMFQLINMNKEGLIILDLEEDLSLRIKFISFCNRYNLPIDTLKLFLKTDS
jgi:hypothetical protein